jgi:hypothetical protein
MTESSIQAREQQHVSDGVLLALIDDERDPEVAAARRHVDVCADCSRRRTLLAEDAAHVRAAIAAVPVPSRPAREAPRRLRRVPMWQRPFVRAIAASIVLAAVAVAGPVRRWVEATRPERDHAARSTATPTPTPASERRGAAIRFSVATSELVVRFDSVPAAGTLTLERSEQNDVSAYAEPGGVAKDDELLILPSELRVRNRSDSRANYRVVVPPNVVRVNVVVAGIDRFLGAAPANVSLRR